MLKIILATVFLLPSIFVNAQAHHEELEVIKVIEQLFDGMRDGDSTALRNTFHVYAQLSTTYQDKDQNKPGFHLGDVDEFVAAVGTPHEKVWNEVIHEYDVRIEQHLASVWTTYSFYVGDDFSHCGVNAFQLVRTDQGWKILNITDTRSDKDCPHQLTPDDQEIQQFLDQWHRAAATADEQVYFGSMTKNGIYIGTDASERWTTEEFEAWAGKYFEREKAWDFTATKRDVYFSADGNTAWFEESLDTWMGTCRGSGVLVRVEGAWKIAHYHLSVTVPNEKIEEFIELTGKP